MNAHHNSRGSGVPTYIIIFVLCAIASIAIRIISGIRINVLGLLILTLCFGSLLSWIYHGIVKGVHDVVNPEKEQVPSEARLFGALADFASSRNGHFQMVGRAGKAVIHQAGRNYEITARNLSNGRNRLVVSSGFDDKEFVILVANDSIRRKDLEGFETGLPEFDENFHCATNDVGRAQTAVATFQNRLLQFQPEVSLTSQRGSLELKRTVDSVDSAHILSTVEGYIDIHGILSGGPESRGSANRIARQAVARFRNTSSPEEA